MYDAKFNHKNACATNSSDQGCWGSHFLFIFKRKHLQTFYGVICSFSESLNEQSNDCSCTETLVLFVWWLIRSIDLIEVEGQFVEYYNAYVYNVIAPWVKSECEHCNHTEGLTKLHDFLFSCCRSSTQCCCQGRDSRLQLQSVWSHQICSIS